MSIEYTIDIQLTELGFPDLAETPETTGGQAHSRPAPTEKKLPASRASSTLSNARKRKAQTANQEAVEANDQMTAATEPQSSASSLKTVTGDNENDNDDSEDSDVSVVGDEEEDDYEAEAIDEGEFDGMAYLT